MKGIKQFSLGSMLLLALSLPGMAFAGIIYQNDFEANANGFVGTTTRTVTFHNSTGNGSTWLGPLNQGQTATLQLSGLVSGNVYNLAFDLMAAGSLDGPGDFFRVYVGAQALIDATFDRQGFLGGQTYSDSTPLGTGGNKPFGSGRDATINNAHLYYFGHGAGNPIMSFTASGSTANINFIGATNQAYADEWFAIDNVLVTGEAAVPEPWTLPLLGLGLAVLGMGRRKAV